MQIRFGATPCPWKWKPITEVETGDILMLGGQQIRVQKLRQDDADWILSYIERTTGRKEEQLYRSGDFVYALMEQPEVPRRRRTKTDDFSERGLWGEEEEE
jgi:hypothetical protein